MNKHRVKRVALLIGVVGLLLAGAFGLSVRSYRRQEALNRRLITALMKQDPQQALALVNAGADPNTPFKPPSPPSLTQLWNLVLHLTEMPGSDNPNAFQLACGAPVYHHNVTTHLGMSTDEPHLVEKMLQHGAQKNAKYGDGWTPFLSSVLSAHPQTLAVLIKQGVDVNAQNTYGETALFWVAWNSFPTPNPSERSKSVDIVRQLLAQGADQNLTSLLGITPLQAAQRKHRLDLVALLRKAGAKK